MKKIITLILLISVFLSKGQDINIPDTNFLNALIELKIDINNDGKIQKSEAEAITGELDLASKKITDLTGLEAFININDLNLYNNNIKTINLSSLTKLKYFSCPYNALTSLDVSMLTNLEHLLCDNNYITDLKIKGANNLIDVKCVSNKLTSLDVSFLKKAHYLRCGYNDLTSLIVSSDNIFSELHCQGNEFTNLDLRNLKNLIFFKCQQNPNLKMICIPDRDTTNYQKDDSAIWSKTCEPIDVNSIQDMISIDNATVVKAYNLQGKEVSTATKEELIILLYSNGMTQKVFQK